jgi:hypothetical protein
MTNALPWNSSGLAGAPSLLAEQESCSKSVSPHATMVSRSQLYL